MTGLVHYKTKLIYTAKRKKKKSLNVFIPQMFQWQMQCSYTFAFYYFSILNLERNTLLYYIYIHIERVAFT